jgi:hypothetical protein
MLLNAQNLSIFELATKEPMSRVPSGVKVSSKGTETTNGHSAIRVSVPQGEAHNEKNFPVIEGVCPEPAPDFILPVDAAKKVKAAIPKRTTIPVLHHAMVGQTSRGTITLATTDLEMPQTFAPRCIDVQRWPNMDAVWPKDGTETAQIQLGAEALISLLRQIVAFDGIKVPSTQDAVFTLKLYGPANAVRLQAVNRETGQELDSILMPVNMPGALPQRKPPAKA